MRNYLCALKLLWRHANGLMSDWLSLSIAKDAGRHCGGRDGALGIMYVANVDCIRDVGDVAHVSDVRGVHSTDILFPIVIPGKVRFARSEREASRQTGDPDTNAH